MTVLYKLALPAVVVAAALGLQGPSAPARATVPNAAAGRLVGAPHVVHRPIPFGAERRTEMRVYARRHYARRHYGINTARLRHPQVIVEHFTASESFQSAFDTFARDTPDVELGELPGTCSHYLIARNGHVFRLVPATLMCRHTVGLNYTAIGIEHVGTSDGEVLGNRAQRRASLRLTRALQARYSIRTRDVIGHAESLSSPFHRERVARLRHQTHGDFAHPAMQTYRRLLGRLALPAR